jgi:deoxyribodipyrimidine photo-lyase
MSSPESGEYACSRLSAHLAYGSISLRSVHQAVEERSRRLRALRADGEDIGRDWLQSLASFGKRLRWHCHFIQKLESEPRLEFENMARAYDGLREADFDLAKFDAFVAGKTGYPMVDACVRSLEKTGWLNFRMRAMLVSFASYDLWLHWRPTALFLARQFVDYEPGIHYSQVQMQSGVTGINALRIYSPTKQLRDQDPEGRFVRRWVPELEGVPLEHLAEPHRIREARESEATRSEVARHQEAVARSLRSDPSSRTGASPQGERMMSRWGLPRDGVGP